MKMKKVMDKSKAIELLGGSIAAAAEKTGVSPQAVGAWPDPLPMRIADRVIAALARPVLPPALRTKLAEAIFEVPDGEPEAPPPAGAPEAQGAAA